MEIYFKYHQDDYSFFQLLTHKIFMSHDFWNLSLKVQNYTPNLQNQKLFLSLWLSFQ